MKDIVLGIVAYNPTKADIENIHYYAEKGYKVYIYNNTEKDFEVISDSINNGFSNIKVFGDGANNGLSIALDELCRAAQIVSQYILLLDQDSRIDDKSIDTMVDIADNNKSAAIICPQIVYQGCEPSGKTDVEEVEWCITSGSIFNLSYFDKQWKFDKNYFIDRVDVDCCKQIQLAGLKMLCANSALLFQELGQTLIRNGKSYSTHSALRCYYMTRNRFYFNHKYGISPIISFGQTFRHVKTIIKNETNFTHKIKMILRGISDYYRGNMRKIKL